MRANRLVRTVDLARLPGGTGDPRAAPLEAISDRRRVFPIQRGTVKDAQCGPRIAPS